MLLVYFKDITPNLNDEEFIEYFNKEGVREAITLFYEYIQETDKWDSEIITENLKKSNQTSKTTKEGFLYGFKKDNNRFFSWT